MRRNSPPSNSLEIEFPVPTEDDDSSDVGVLVDLRGVDFTQLTRV